MIEVSLNTSVILKMKLPRYLRAYELFECLQVLHILFMSLERLQTPLFFQITN